MDQLFKEGRDDIKDAPRIVRPITGVTDENIELLRVFIEGDPYCTYDEIEDETSLCRGTVQNIIHFKIIAIAKSKIFNYVFLTAYMKALLMQRNHIIKEHAETGKWKTVLPQTHI